MLARRVIPILWETGVGSDVMKPIAAPIVGRMITSTVHVLILVPVFFALMKGTRPTPRHIATEGTILGHRMSLADCNRWMQQTIAWYPLPR